MIQLSKHLSDISAVCQANDAKRLEMFGSWAREDHTSESDVDFIVEFNDPLRPGLFDRFLVLRSALEEILGKNVDLVEHSSVQNPVLASRINEDKEVVYAA